MLCYNMFVISNTMFFIISHNADDVKKNMGKTYCTWCPEWMGRKHTRTRTASTFIRKRTSERKNGNNNNNDSTHLQRNKKRKTRTKRTQKIIVSCCSNPIQAKRPILPDIILSTRCHYIGEPFWYHEEVLSLQPMFPPKPLDTLPLEVDAQKV